MEMCVGLFMALQPKIIACGNTIASFAMAVRFITGPAVMAAASIAVGLRGVLLHIAIVQVMKTKHKNLNDYHYNVNVIYVCFICRRPYLKGLSLLWLRKNTMFILTF